MESKPTLCTNLEHCQLLNSLFECLLHMLTCIGAEHILFITRQFSISSFKVSFVAFFAFLYSGIFNTQMLSRCSHLLLQNTYWIQYHMIYVYYQCAGYQASLSASQ
jgi:hypothetical protein